MSHSSQLYTGQVTGLGATAQPLVTQASNHPSIREVMVQADPDNTTDALVGNASAQYIKLVPGQGFAIPINNLYSIYVRMESATTGTVSWFARD